MSVNDGLQPITLTSRRGIGPGWPCFVVAEIGQNHNGDAYLATRLLKAAHDAGVNACKLCKRNIEDDLTAAARAAPYIGPQSYGATYGEHRRRLELTAEEYRHLKERMRYNHWQEILFATACDIRSVDDVEESIHPPLWKIASRDIDNIPLLKYVAGLRRPVLLSCGMTDGDTTIREAIDTVSGEGSEVVLLVCTSEYPTPNNHVRLWRLAEYRKRFGVLVGLSDHTSGITAGIAAAALGACVVEKHLTLSRAMKGTDHAASLEPEGMRRMVEKIREVEEMCCGSTDFVDVTANRIKLGRSLVTRRAIAAGERIEMEDVCLKSPGDGAPWRLRNLIVGHVARRGLPADITIQPTDVVIHEAANA